MEFSLNVSSQTMIVRYCYYACQGVAGLNVEALMQESVGIKTTRLTSKSLALAIQDGVSNGFTHLLVFDGSKLPSSRDISKLLAASLESPWSFFPDQPGFGAARIYPLFHVQTIRPWFASDHTLIKEIQLRVRCYQAVAKFFGYRPWSGKLRGGKFGNWIIRTISHRLGLRASYLAILFVIPYFWLFAPKARRASRQMFQLLKPNVGFLSGQWLILEHFYRFATNLLDRLYQSKFEKPQFDVIGSATPTLLSLLEDSKGTVLIGAHYGAMDIGAASNYARGVHDRIKRFEFMAESGVTTRKIIPSDKHQENNLKIFDQSQQSVFFFRELIDSGKSIYLKADRPTTNQYELVTFCNRLAAFDASPFKIAALCQTKISFCFAIKRGLKVYECQASKPKLLAYLPNISRELQVYQWIQEFAKELEQVLRDDPFQWANMYPFWSSLPASPDREMNGKVRAYLYEDLALDTLATKQRMTETNFVPVSNHL